MLAARLLSDGEAGHLELWGAGASACWAQAWWLACGCLNGGSGKEKGAVCVVVQTESERALVAKAEAGAITGI